MGWLAFDHRSIQEPNIKTAQAPETVMTNQRFSEDTRERVARMLDRCEAIMSEAIKKYGAERRVMAPVNTGPVVSGTMVAVDLRPDEDIQWIWSHEPQRGSYASGYTIVPRMGDQSQTQEEAMSETEAALRVAELERRIESHDIVLGMLETVCDLMKAPDASHLTGAQRTELSRRLDEYEKDPEAGAPWPEVKRRIVEGR